MDRIAPQPSDLRSPIFIGGQRRSGTSLFRVLLNRHSRITCGPESKFLQDASFRLWHERLIDEWRERVERYGFGPAEVDGAMAALVDSLFTGYQRREGKQRWAEKTPTNILSIDYLFRLFPSAQFIHVVRDPRDTCCSIRERAQRDRPEWSKFRPKRVARDWRAALEAGIPWRERPDRYLEIRYEDLVENPEAVMRRVLAFLGEPWDARVLDPNADTEESRRDQQVRHGPIMTSSLGRWRKDLEEAAVVEIEKVAGDLMVELGYPLSECMGRARENGPCSHTHPGGTSTIGEGHT